MSVKRPIGEVEAAVEPAGGLAEKKTKLVDDAHSVEQRLLISSSEVGTIIGRQGTNIKQVRDSTNVYASILKAGDGVTERVLSIKGTVSSIAQAVRQFAELLIQAQKDRDAKNGTAAEGEAKYAVKFLCHSSQAGAVIGKGGAIIRVTIADTGARISLSTDPLVNSTEKSITVTGTPTNINDAALRIMQALVDNPPKPGIPSRPYTPFAAPPAAAYGGGYGAPPPQYGGPPLPQHHQQYAPAPHSHYAAAPPAPRGYGAPPPHHHPAHGLQGPPPPQHMGGGAPQGGPGGDQKQKIVIPTVCAGNVIGHGGRIISDIRKQSGTFVSIAKPEPSAPHERVVTITGSMQGIRTAVHLIRQVVEQYEGAVPAAY